MPASDGASCLSAPTRLCGALKAALPGAVTVESDGESFTNWGKAREQCEVRVRRLKRTMAWE